MRFPSKKEKKVSTTKMIINTSSDLQEFIFGWIKKKQNKKKKKSIFIPPPRY